MLDLGFLPDVERLLAKTPASRQTMLFSATMPSAIVTLARRHLEHPVNIRAESAEDGTTVPATAQFVYQAHMLDKPEVVARILQAQDREPRDDLQPHQAFRAAADRRPVERGFAATSIHGDLNQVAREKALKRFREGKVDVLVATDVAARGIDVTGVTHVINYECPDDEKTYVHRIGRTGRAGASGIAITFVDWADQTRWKVINNALGLPFEVPEETYSTSAHLFHDLGIDPKAKGRLNEPTPEPPRERDTSSRGPGRRRARARARAGATPRARARARLRAATAAGAACATAWPSTRRRDAGRLERDRAGDRRRRPGRRADPAGGDLGVVRGRARRGSHQASPSSRRPWPQPYGRCDSTESASDEPVGCRARRSVVRQAVRRRAWSVSGPGPSASRVTTTLLS